LVALAGVVGKVTAQKSTNLHNTPKIEEALRQAAKAVNETAPLQIEVLEYAYYGRDVIELEIVSIETAKCK